MKIESVFDAAFAPYGKVLPGYDTSELLAALEKYTPLPEATDYVASQPELEALPIAAQLASNAYGGMPIQLGWCNGHNTRLNCLEYHRDSEINCGTADFILLVAREDDIAGGVLDTDRVRAFRVPRGVVVEVYATTLHYAPCHADPAKGFRVMVALPAGTNTDFRLPGAPNPLDRQLWARNKWLIAHADSAPAANGAVIGLTGENIDIAGDL